MDKIIRFLARHKKQALIGTIALGIVGFCINYKWKQKRQSQEQNNQQQQLPQNPSQSYSNNNSNQGNSDNSTQLIPQGQQQEEQGNENPQPVQIQMPEKCPLIEKIYDKTCRARNVDPEFRKFVGNEQSQQYLLQEYGTSSEIKRSLRAKLTGMRRVRGDGNCFYTSFGYQYLGFLLTQSNDDKFNQFIQNVATQPWIILLEGQEIDETRDLNIAFQQFCNQIRGLIQQERAAKFHELFSDPDCQLYGLTVIYLRNLAYNLCLQNEETKSLFATLGMDLKQQLLEWEYDCENNQSVIALLSENLQLTINFYFVDNENQKVITSNYKPNNQQSLFEINLLFRPGHYNVAIPI